MPEGGWREEKVKLGRVLKKKNPNDFFFAIRVGWIKR